MFLNIQIDLLILKTYYGQFTLTTQKSLRIIFNGRKLWPLYMYDVVVKRSRSLSHLLMSSCKNKATYMEMSNHTGVIL